MLPGLVFKRGLKIFEVLAQAVHEVPFCKTNPAILLGERRIRFPFARSCLAHVRNPHTHSPRSIALTGPRCESSERDDFPEEIGSIRHTLAAPDRLQKLAVGHGDQIVGVERTVLNSIGGSSDKESVVRTDAAVLHPDAQRGIVQAGLDALLARVTEHGISPGD